MRPRILLIGKTGQLGYALHRLLPQFAPVLAPEHSELDLLDAGNIRCVVREARPQFIVNAAAYTAVDAAESDEANARAINSVAPGILAEEALRAGATLVHYSTDYVFDGAKKTPYVENDQPNPINVYGRTKLAGEQAIRDSGASHLIFRTSWVYAPRGRNFVRAILRMAAEREELKIVNDQVGAPSCAIDLAAATAKILMILSERADGPAALIERSGTYNMTATGETTWYEFAQAVLQEAAGARPDLAWLSAATNGRPLIARRVLPISSQEFRTPASRPAYSVLCNARLREAFGIALADWRAQLKGCFEAGSLANSLPNLRNST